MKEKFYIEFKKTELDKALYCAEVIKNRNYIIYSSLENDIKYQNDAYVEPIAIWISNQNDVFVNVATKGNKEYWKNEDIKQITFDEFIGL